MDWTNLTRSLYTTTTGLEQADLIPKLKIAVKRIQQLSKLALTILLALIFSMTGFVIPVPLIPFWILDFGALDSESIANR